MTAITLCLNRCFDNRWVSHVRSDKEHNVATACAEESDAPQAFNSCVQQLAFVLA